jgi:hypothetical protein
MGLVKRILDEVRAGKTLTDEALAVVIEKVGVTVEEAADAARDHYEKRSAEGLRNAGLTSPVRWTAPDRLRLTFVSLSRQSPTRARNQAIFALRYFAERDRDEIDNMTVDELGSALDDLTRKS